MLFDRTRNKEVLDKLQDPRVTVREALGAIGWYPSGSKDVEEALDEALITPWRDWSQIKGDVATVAGGLVDVVVGAQEGPRALLDLVCPDLEIPAVKPGGRYFHHTFEELVLAALLEDPSAPEVCAQWFSFEGDLHYVELGPDDHSDNLWRGLSVLHGPLSYELVRAPADMLTSWTPVDPGADCDVPVHEAIETAEPASAVDTPMVLEAVDALWTPTGGMTLATALEVARAL